jgi:serine/threonine-protein kinase RsbW
VKTAEIEISSSRHNISEVEAFMVRVNDDFKLPLDKFQQLMIAVTELVVNCIVHGNKELGHKKVGVLVEYDDSIMVIKIADEGNGFDMSILRDPRLPENILKESGRGFFIAKSMVDELKYEHNEKGSIFTVLIKK